MNKFLIALLSLLTVFTTVAFAKDCDKGKPCGKTCINIHYTCHVDATPMASVEAHVIRVVDGDTLHVLAAGKELTVRLIGVDTPETVKPGVAPQPFGQEASDYTKSRLTDIDVKLEFDVQPTDKYGRTLAYVWVGDELFNLTLVQEGLAQVDTYPPNVKYVELFSAAQTIARDNQKGMWAP